jgi:sugar lactone lactonase YvrE
MQRAMIACLVVSVAACGGQPTTVANPDPDGPPAPTLEPVATSERRWTGIAAMPDGRILVNFPRWAPEHGVSVGELRADGSIRPYPDPVWNAWTPGDDPTSAFVCVQAMWVDDRGRLWILDPANPMFQGVVEGGPKLIEVDPRTDRVVRTIVFGSQVAPPDSYLNDVRVDSDREVAFLTDSGNGALVTVDLATGTARRVLDEHPSTHAEDVTLTIGGEPWLRPDGSRPQVHADGIALAPDREWVYWQALTGRTLYRIPVARLADPAVEAERLADSVERVAAVGASDGIVFGPDGALYLTSLEHDAIRRWTRDHGLQTVVADPRISWPDSFAIEAEGTLLFTTAQIHLADPTEPFRVFRLRMQ